MKYIVTGKVAEPTTDQHQLATNTGGWRVIEINNIEVMWNACVSPPFGGGMHVEF
jgi:hypothetical protein